MYSYPTVFIAHRIQAQGLSDIIQYLMNARRLMIYSICLVVFEVKFWQKRKKIIVKARICVKASKR